MTVRSVREPLDPERAARAFDNDRHRLILAAVVRAREIFDERRKNDPLDQQVYDHSPGGQALIDFATGTCGAEYLDRIHSRQTRR
jgi:DNA-directed RNA polymerase subunit K/omega